MNKQEYRLKRLRRRLGALPKTLYFNYHYLPFQQAVKLPIWVYKADLVCTRGKVVIDCPTIKTGMITMGYRDTSIYANNGIMWENKGGTVVFKGICRIGNDSYISIGEKATVTFGNDFRCSAAMKLVSKKEIRFGTCVSIGWDTVIMDTNIHSIYDIERKRYKKNCGPIAIGDYNWFGTGCKVMHSVSTPERCIFGAGTIVTRNTPAKSYCIMSGTSVRILTENVMRDFEHDDIHET